MNRLACLIALLLPAAAAGGEQPLLKNNPFSRPPAPMAIEEPRPNAEAGDPPLLLIATMVSTSGALANVEGRVLRPGQELRGYRLKRIFENRAVFEKNGNELTIYVKPELDENDEATQTKPRRR